MSDGESVDRLNGLVQAINALKPEDTSVEVSRELISSIIRLMRMLAEDWMRMALEVDRLRRELKGQRGAQ